MRYPHFKRCFRLGRFSIGLLFLLGPSITFAQEYIEATTEDDLRPRSLDLPGPMFINTADFAVPYASEIIIDVPSPFHWSRYQIGQISGLRYSLFPDGTATITNDTDQRRVLITLTCEKDVSCTISTMSGDIRIVPAIGAPTPTLPDSVDDKILAQYLADWILAGTGSPPAPLVIDLPIVELDVIQPPTNPLEAEETSGTDAEAVASEIDALNDDVEASTDIVVSEPVCAEIDPFMPSECAQPTADIIKPEIRAVSRIAEENATKPALIALAVPMPDASEVVPQPDAPETMLERHNLQCSVTGSVSLDYVNTSNDDGGVGKPRASFGCSSALTDKLSLRFSLLDYLISGQQKPWDPDFTYAFDYRLNDDISFGYSNYSAKFGGGTDGFFGSLFSGNLRGSYKLPKLILPNEKLLSCSVSTGLPDPRGASTNLSCGYAITDKIRVSGTANFYFSGSQGDYDPDYNYTASFRPNTDWLITYSNYSNNRWPWNKGDNAGPGLKGGSVSVTRSIRF